jgi:hypothetical protein
MHASSPPAGPRPARCVHRLEHFPSQGTRRIPPATEPGRDPAATSRPCWPSRSSAGVARWRDFSCRNWVQETGTGGLCPLHCPPISAAAGFACHRPGGRTAAGGSSISTSSGSWSAHGAAGIGSLGRRRDPAVLSLLRSATPLEPIWPIIGTEQDDRLPPQGAPKPACRCGGGGGGEGGREDPRVPTDSLGLRR